MLLKRELGSTKPSFGRVTIHTGAFVVKGSCFCWNKTTPAPCSRGQCLLMGKRASWGPLCCVGMPATQVPELGLPSPPRDPCKRSAHTLQVQPELLGAQSSVAGVPGHKSHLIQGKREVRRYILSFRQKVAVVESSTRLYVFLLD